MLAFINIFKLIKRINLYVKSFDLGSYPEWAKFPSVREPLVVVAVEFWFITDTGIRRDEYKMKVRKLTPDSFADFFWQFAQ